MLYRFVAYPFFVTAKKKIELLPEDIVVARLTGDGMADDLIAPDWSRKKVSVINDIDKLLFERGSWQGRRARAMKSDLTGR